jgi:hypothetical protein
MIDLNNMMLVVIFMFCIIAGFLCTVLFDLYFLEWYRRRKNLKILFDTKEHEKLGLSTGVVYLGEKKQ